MTAAEAKRTLEKMISSAPAGVKEIDIIHGYTGGTALQRMVRTELKHKRITGKLLSLNPGVTTLTIKENKEKTAK